VVGVYAYPDNDTFRGGTETAVYAPTSKLFDTSEDATFLGSYALPATWSDISSGSGIVTVDTRRGALLDTAGAPASIAAIQKSTSLHHFDAAIDVVLVAPWHTRQGVIDAAELRFTTGSDIFFVKATIGPDDLALITSSYTVGGVTTVGGTASFDLRSRFTLRLVKNGERVFAFVGRRGADRRYTELVKLHDAASFPDLAGGLDVRAANNTAATSVRAYVSNFTIESHARIGPRLLEDKRVAFRRITGIVPAATLEEVGLNELVAFGLFGQVISPAGFEYTLPVPRTVGRAQDRAFEDFTDEQLRDGT
jgi:hypothetical protein